MALSASLQNSHAYAQFYVDRQFRSNLFKVPTLLAALSRKGATEGRMGRPGAASVVGKPLTTAQAETMAGTTQRHIFFQQSRVGGGKVLGTDDTTSSTGTDRQDKKKRSTAISWALYEQPITVRNSTLRKAKGGAAYGSAIEDATEMAMEELLETVAGDCWHGNPSSHTAEDYDSMIGLEQWLDDDNTIGSIDRSSVTGFNAYRDDTGIVTALSTIDDVNLDATKGLSLFGGRSDVVITAPPVYAKLKQEAMSAGGQIVHDSRPEGAQVGFMNEYINYNNSLITFDPYATNEAGSQDHMAILDSRTWTFESDSEDNCRVTRFVDQSEEGPHGSDDVTTAKVRWGIRLSCDRPKRNALLTNVT